MNPHYDLSNKAIAENQTLQLEIENRTLKEKLHISEVLLAAEKQRSAIAENYLREGLKLNTTSDFFQEVREWQIAVKEFYPNL